MKKARMILGLLVVLACFVAFSGSALAKVWERIDWGSIDNGNEEFWNDMTFELRKIVNDGRLVIVHVQDDINLGDHAVAKRILNRAAKFAHEQAPDQDYPCAGIVVNICYPGENPKARYDYEKGCPSVKAENYARYVLTWSRYKNIVEKKRIEREEQRQRQARQEEEQRIYQEKKNQEMLAKHAKEIAKATFLKKHGVVEQLSGKSSVKAFYSNPFIYEGKIIGVEMKFDTMTSASEAIFMMEDYCAGYYDPVVVSNVPKTAFTGGEIVLLAVKVLGKTDFQYGPITVSVPHLKFVGVHFDKN